MRWPSWRGASESKPETCRQHDTAALGEVGGIATSGSGRCGRGRRRPGTVWHDLDTQGTGHAGSWPRSTGRGKAIANTRHPQWAAMEAASRPGRGGGRRWQHCSMVAICERWQSLSFGGGVLGTKYGGLGGIESGGARKSGHASTLTSYTSDGHAGMQCERSRAQSGQTCFQLSHSFLCFTLSPGHLRDLLFAPWHLLW